MWGSRDRTRLGRGERGRWIALGILVAWVGMSRLEGGAAAPETGQAPGLVAEFWDAADKERVLDVDVFTQLALFVPAGDPVSSFLESDSFEVEWSGAISVPLRDDFRFRVWVSGQVELMLNGESVLTLAHPNGEQPWGIPLRLNAPRFCPPNRPATGLLTLAPGCAQQLAAWESNETGAAAGGLIELEAREEANE